MVTTRQSGLGYEVCVGLLAGPAEFQRLRETTHSGPLGRLWRRFASYAEEQSRHESLLPVADLALIAAVTGRGDLALKAVAAALEIAHQPHWVHWEAGCMPLSGMHYAHALSLATDWLWPVLGRDQKEALLGALIAKAQENLTRAPAGVRDEDGNGQLLFVRRQDINDPFVLHPHASGVNNWDLWFSSGVYMIAALAERAWLKPDPAWPKLAWGRYYDVGYELDDARIARWKGVALERITTAMASQLGPDGDYAEGISYADYGGRALLHALTVLERTDGIDRWTPGMLKLPYWIRNQYIADLPFGVANFNDARMQTGYGAPLLAYVAGRTRDPRMQGYVLEVLEQMDDPGGFLVLLGFDPRLPAEPMTREPATLYAHTGQVTWRTAEDRSGIFFSMKAGAHGGAHQHRDRGSFFLSAYGDHLIVDTGDGRYANPPAAPKFDATEAHNCVLIDGKGQIGSNDNPVSGHILEHSHDGNLSTALADASECYEGITSVRRRVVFLRPDVFVLADRVQGDCQTLTWLLHGNNADGKANWELGDRRAILHRPGATLYVFFTEPVGRQQVGLGSLDGTHGAIMRLETDIAGTAVNAVLIPARPDETAPECTYDGVTMTIGFRGVTHTVTMGDAAVTVDGQAYGIL